MIRLIMMINKFLTWIERTCDREQARTSCCSRQDLAIRRGRSRELDESFILTYQLEQFRCQDTFWKLFPWFAVRPDIWTAATPVIIQEAALNGSADNRGDIYNNITLLSFHIIILIIIYDYLSSSKRLNGSADNEGDIYDEHAIQDFMMVMTWHQT